MATAKKSDKKPSGPPATYTDNGKNFYTVRDAEPRDIEARDRAAKEQAEREAKAKAKADAEAAEEAEAREPKAVVIKDTKTGTETVISRSDFIAYYRKEDEPKK